VRTLLRYAVVLVAVYFATWTAAYAVIVRGGDGVDFRYFLEYLRMGWTFSGGELPTFVWFFSLIAFLPLAGLSVFLLRRYARR
jgi:hypothetical protein